MRFVIDMSFLTTFGSICLFSSFRFWTIVLLRLVDLSSWFLMSIFFILVVRLLMSVVKVIIICTLGLLLKIVMVTF